MPLVSMFIVFPQPRCDKQLTRYSVDNIFLRKITKKLFVAELVMSAKMFITYSFATIFLFRIKTFFIFFSYSFCENVLRKLPLAVFNFRFLAYSVHYFIFFFYFFLFLKQHDTQAFQNTFQVIAMYMLCFNKKYSLQNFSIFLCSYIYFIVYYHTLEQTKMLNCTVQG